MIVTLVILSTIFCQIIFVFTAPPEKSLQQSALQDPVKPNINTNILFDYVTTEAGIYKIHQTRVSWFDARNICLDENAQLAVIDTVADEAVILKHMRENKIKDQIWLGIHELFGRNQWTTITGDRLFKSQRYVHWAYGQPNHTGDGKQCAVLNPSGMNDIPCDKEMNGFVCEKISNDFQEILKS